MTNIGWKRAQPTPQSPFTGTRSICGTFPPPKEEQRRRPDTATVEDLRNFQLYLVDHGTSPITLNATITGLKFFFGITLDRAPVDDQDEPGVCPSNTACRVEP